MSVFKTFSAWNLSFLLSEIKHEMVLKNRFIKTTELKFSAKLLLTVKSAPKCIPENAFFIKISASYFCDLLDESIGFLKLKNNV